MVRAWYMDDSNEDQREEHRRNPDQPIELKDLAEKTGVVYFDLLDSDGKSFKLDELERIKKQRGYTYQDEVNICEDKLPNYHEKLKHFFTEHLHSDEEIRLCLEGSGYFDVRDGNDEWIRIEMVPGDMIILPAGIYHRFTLDTKNYIKAQRFFVGEPVWTPHNRPAEEHPARLSYTKAYPTQCAA